MQLQLLNSYFLGSQTCLGFETVFVFVDTDEVPVLVRVGGNIASDLVRSVHERSEFTLEQWQTKPEQW